MKVPLSWLKEYLAVDEPAAKIAERLTLLGLEVEAIESFAPSFENVVVGKVVTCEKHPDAEKLQVAQVTDGAELFQVVCGAPNCRPGLKTAFCKVGASLEDEEGKKFAIRKAKIRGIESFGMLCSAKELRLGEEHEGILELPETLAEGMPLQELYRETIFDISLTPNLGFASSIIGVARELAASLSAKVKLPKGKVVEDASQKIGELLSVSVEEEKLCPRYAARVIRGVTIRPSPLWLQDRLLRSGVRPVNNVVDVTNYVLLEMGHPLHAFDLEKVEGKKIAVRPAKEGERLTTLDGKERLLEEGFLLICDAKKPLALAGVMGGAESEISDKTTDVILESACFEPRVIRRAAKRYALLTDAARRFQTGADPNNVLPALERAAALIAELSGGKVAEGVIECKSGSFTPKKISLRVSRTNKLLGTKFSPGEVESLFKRLGYPASWSDQDTLVVEVPTYRTDVAIEEDLIEEVARIHGFDNLPRTAAQYKTSRSGHSPLFLFERAARARLVAEGLQEMITCDLISPKQAQMMLSDAISEASLVKVLNPTSVEQSVMRPALLPGLLAAVKYNADRQTESISAFEIGKTHFKSGDAYREQSAFAIIMTGKTRPHHWEEKPRDADFFDLKGLSESILRGLHVSDVQFVPSTLPIFHPGRQASLKLGEMVLGSIGELHPALTQALGLDQRVYYVEISIHDLMQASSKRLRMSDIPQFPGSERDWTITMRETAPVETVFHAARSESSHLLKEIVLRDIYRSERLGSDAKNVTFRFVYRDEAKTVSQAEVDAEHARITEKILKQLGKAVI